MYIPDQIETDRARLAFECYDRGYANATIGDPISTRHGNRLVLEFPVDEGPQFRFGNIAVAGTLHAVETDIREGQMFSMRPVRAAIARLERRFPGSSVTPRTKLDLDARRISVTFEIEWRWPWDVL